MVKRVSAILCILIANILFLAHNVVSHHHHEEEVCFVNSHCRTHHNSDEHSTTGHDHEHDSENNYQHCILQQDVILPSDNLKQEYKYFKYVYNPIGFNVSQASMLNVGLIKFVPSKHSCLLPPFLLSLHTCLACSCLGLRAPPLFES